MTDNVIFKLMNNYAPISPEQEKTATKEKLILHNLRLGWQLGQKYAKKYPGMDQEEIISEIFLAMSLAADRWDRKSSRYTSYMAQYIRACIKGFSSENCGVIKKNTMYIWKNSQIQKFISEYKQKNKIEPTIQEISEGTGLSEKTVYNVYFMQINSVTSIDESVNDDTSDSHGLFACEKTLSPFEESVKSNLTEIIDQLINDLTPEESQIIKYKYYENMKYNEIANKLNLTHSKIKVLEKNAMNKIKHEFIKLEC